MVTSRLISGHSRISPELLWLSTGIGMCVLPHTMHIPAWASLIFFSLLAIRILLREKTVKKYFVTMLFFRLLVGGMIFSGVFITYGTMVGRDAGVTLLVLLGGMKLLEIKAERDYFISVYIGFLLILTNFFYLQTLPISLYMGVAVLVLIASLVSFNDRGASFNLAGRIKIAAGLYVYALPLMLIMFLLFPRVSGPLWGLPKDAQSGISGIDDEMVPGSISELILSDEVAFRVEFNGPIPERSKLYWRGPVLWHTDGFKWVPDIPDEPELTVNYNSDPLNYTVTLEPTDKNWLFSLDIPSQAAEDSRLTHDLQLRTRRSVINRTRYELSSYIDYEMHSNNPEELEDALQLPGNYHPKTIELARSWRREGLSDRGIIDRALTHFNQETFYYTLTPPIFINDNIDEFMFESRQGFCEHYAAAFTILMRAAGIPTRVVTGYQGGTINPVGQYLIVYQRDAHAWTEVWLGDEGGWVRVDPTSAVSPSRVTQGIESALPDTLINVPPSIFNNGFSRDIWENMSNTFDAINNRWNQWVLGYDRNRQRFFLSQLGLGELRRKELMIGLIVMLTISLVIISYGMFSRTAIQSDKARTWHEKFKQRLSTCGIQIYDYEGPADLAKRAATQRKDLAKSIHEISQTYIDVRYKGKLEFLEQLERQVRHFKPAKTPG